MVVQKLQRPLTDLLWKLTVLGTKYFCRISKHGNSLHEDATESIKAVKDVLIESGGQNNVKISTETIKVYQVSRTAYYKNLEKKKQEK